MYTEQRKAQILRLLEKDGSINVNKLADHFQISRETIRRDLSDLERQGVLKRTHGGAVLATISPTQTREFPVQIRGIRHIEEKKQICQKAASFIESGDTLFVDNSSTLLHLPQYIPAEKKITILTNSINFLLEATKYANHNWLMICLGGVFNPSNLSVHGAGTLKIAEEYYPSKAFFSCAGISMGNKIADSSHHEIEAKRMMITRAQKAILLADHSKLAKAGSMHLCDFEDVDTLITDSIAEMKEPEYLTRTGIRIVLADKETQ